MFIKKYTLAAIVSCASLSAIAADTVQFTVEANIPTSSFYVVPDGDWNIRPVTLNYDPATENLAPTSVKLRAKNTSGGINAYLDATPQLLQNAGVNIIPLAVSVGGKVLSNGSGNAVPILTDVEASVERPLNVQIASGTVGPHEPGAYTGTVTMMFDAVPTP